MPVGFIGLGALGAAIAGRLREQGEQLTVWNRTAAKAEASGAEVASSPADLISRVDTCFICLFDSEAVQSVLTGENGLLLGDCAGKLIIDLTTNHFQPVVSFHETVANRGALYLECPVFGSVVPASNGTLTLVASGEQAAFDRARPLLEKFGRHLFHLPQPSLATRMKLVNNLLLGTFMASIAEAVALAEAAGIPKETVLEILPVGAGNSGVLSAKRQKLLDEDFSPHFNAALIHKDLSGVLDLAEHTGKSAAGAETARQLFARVLEQGGGAEDFSVIYRILKANSK